MIEIRVENSIVSVQETQPLYAGCVDVQTCRFTFDKSWEPFSKTAVFRTGNTIHGELLDENGCCDLPWELLTRKNIGYALEVGIYGVSADAEILTSEWDDIGLIREGTSLGGDALNPADGLYQQIMKRLKALEEKIDALGVQLPTLVQRAESAEYNARKWGEAAQAALRMIEDLLINSGVRYYIEFGTLPYQSTTTEELSFQFSQAYESKPAFIVDSDDDRLSVRVEAITASDGFYTGGKAIIENTSGESISATVAISAYCSLPRKGDS